MKKVLITGIGGFVGKHLAHFLLSQSDYEVIGTYRSATSLERLADIKDTVSLVHVDLMDTLQVQGLIKEHQVDYIVHLAAQASASLVFVLKLIDNLRFRPFPERQLMAPIPTNDANQSPIEEKDGWVAEPRVPLSLPTHPVKR